MGVEAVLKNASEKITKFLEGSVTRWNTARNDAAYNADKLAKDLVGFWSDAMGAWSALMPYGGSPMLPTLIVRVPSGSKQKGDVYLAEDVNPALTVSFTDLQEIGGAGKIAKAKVKKTKLTYCQLEIEVDLSAGGVTAGAYQGLAWDATVPQPLAVVLAAVT